MRGFFVACEVDKGWTTKYKYIKTYVYWCFFCVKGAIVCDMMLGNGYCGGVLEDIKSNTPQHITSKDKCIYET